MKLKMLTSMSGPLLTLNRGDITEAFSSKEAKRMIKAGFAEPAEDDPAEALAAKVAELDALAVEHDSLKAAAETSAADLAAALAAIQTLTDSVAAQDAEIAALKASLSEAEGNLVEALADRDKFHGQVVELEVLLKAAETELDAAAETAVKPKAPEKRG